ncbi:MAG: threonylcarbamoyl-AMP synthase [Cytophagaceae bacterium]|nr:threonylcarbamoyl-AMP synthase [Cytophagaceae bacterium]
MKFQEEEIDKALLALRAGKVILYPTDTIWGLGCDASNEEAVRKIFEIKQRADSKALIILISRIEQLRDYVQKIPDIAWDIVDYSEKPLTVVYPGGRNVAKNVLAEDGSIAIRLVRDEFCMRLIDKFRKPLVSTSANISGMPSAATFQEIKPEILSQVHHIVNHRQDEKNPSSPSVVMKISMNGEVKFLRK